MPPQLARGADAVILAVGPRRDGSDPLDKLMRVSRALVEGLRQAGAGRLIVAGGAGRRSGQDMSVVAPPVDA